MSKRNLIWLAAIVVAFVVVWLSVGVLWGILAAAIVLIASETIERTARQRRVAARGDHPITPIRSNFKRKRR